MGKTAKIVQEDDPGGKKTESAIEAVAGFLKFISPKYRGALKTLLSGLISAGGTAGVYEYKKKEPKQEVLLPKWQVEHVCEKHGNKSDFPVEITDKNTKKTTVVLKRNPNSSIFVADNLEFIPCFYAFETVSATELKGVDYDFSNSKIFIPQCQEKYQPQ
jgi:hypothetical protein